MIVNTLGLPCTVCGQSLGDGFQVDVHRQAHLNRENGHGVVSIDGDRFASLDSFEREVTNRERVVTQREAAVLERESQAEAEADKLWWQQHASTSVPDTSIAYEAWGLVFGARQAAYGHPSSDFTAMGRIASAILSRWMESAGIGLVYMERDGYGDPIEGPVHLPDIPPRIVALLMTAVKLSRESAQHKRDNLVDLIGYTLCADRIAEGT